MIYATTDANGLTISERAVIRGFASESEALSALAREYDLEPGERLVLDAGSFGDCWIKTHDAPRPDGLLDTSPFALDDLIVQAPGSHPGGRAWWLTPSDPVMVAVIVRD